MKFSSALNGATIISTLGVIVIFCLSESDAASCKQYGHSCWGGHGKRGVPEKGPQTEDNWFISKLTRSNLRKSVIPEMGYVLSQPSVEAAKGIALIRPDHSAIEEFSETNLESDNAEERPTKDGNIQELLFLTDSAAVPEKYNLMQMLKSSYGITQ